VRTEALVSLETGQMVAEGLLCELGRLFDQGQFTAVRVQANPLAVELADPLLCARAESLAYLAEVYDAWDRFAWAEAFSLLRTYRRREQATACLTRAGWDLSKLTAQMSYLGQCKDSRVRPQRLGDLLANARRRIEQGRYDDATARLYRLSEYVVQVRFRTQFGIRRLDNPTSKVPMASLEQRTPRLAGDLRLQKRVLEGDVVNLGLRSTIEALAEIGDQVGPFIKERCDPHAPPLGSAKTSLGNLLEARNQSLLAHGTAPVEKEIATALYEEVRAVLSRHLQAENLDLAAILSPAVFLACPWG